MRLKFNNSHRQGDEDFHTPHSADYAEEISRIRKEEVALARELEYERSRTHREAQKFTFYKKRKRRLAIWVSGRSALFLRDHGICAICGLDTSALYEAIQIAKRKIEAGEWWLDFGLFLKAIGRQAQRWPQPLWDMDHRIPFSQGGVNDIMNLRTLCLECHRLETKKLYQSRGRRFLPTPDLGTHAENERDKLRT